MGKRPDHARDEHIARIKERHAAWKADLLRDLAVVFARHLGVVPMRVKVTCDTETGPLYVRFELQ